MQDEGAGESFRDTHTPMARILYVDKGRNAPQSEVFLVMSGSMWPHRMIVPHSRHRSVFTGRYDGQRVLDLAIRGDTPPRRRVPSATSWGVELY